MDPGSPVDSHNGVWVEADQSDGYIHVNLPVWKGHASSNTPQQEGLESAPANEFPKFPPNLPNWSNINVLHENTLPPRASFVLYNNLTDARTRDVKLSKTKSLTGTWKFNLYKSPFDAPDEFLEKDYDCEKWSTVEVPGIWQLQGYGKGPQYVGFCSILPASLIGVQIHQRKLPLPCGSRARSS